MAGRKDKSGKAGRPQAGGRRGRMNTHSTSPCARSTRRVRLGPRAQPLHALAKHDPDPRPVAQRLSLKAWQRPSIRRTTRAFRAATVEHLKGRSKRFEYDYRYRDRKAIGGSWRGARTALAIRDKGQVPCAWSASTGDITDIKRTEQALKESEQRYALATRRRPRAFTVEPRDRPRVPVRPVQALFRDQGQSPHGKVWNTAIHAEDYEGYRSALKAYFKGRAKNFEHEYRVRNLKGKYSWVMDRGVGVRDQNGRVTRMVGALSDVTSASFTK